jgi:hypothetical protein
MLLIPLTRSYPCEKWVAPFSTTVHLVGDVLPSKVTSSIYCHPFIQFYFMKVRGNRPEAPRLGRGLGVDLIPHVPPCPGSRASHQHRQGEADADAECFVDELGFSLPRFPSCGGDRKLPGDAADVSGGGMRQVGVISEPCSLSMAILLSPWAEPS